MNKNYKNKIKKIDLGNIRLTSKGKKTLNKWLENVSPRIIERRDEYPELTDEILYKMAVSRHYKIWYYDGFAHGKTYFDKVISIYKNTSDDIKGCLQNDCVISWQLIE